MSGDDESTRSFIIGAFALTGRDELAAAQLIALAKPCRITATNVKSHLTRMVADGSLRRDERPRASTYRPSERRRRVMDAIRVRLRLSEQPWDGRWLLLLPRLPAERLLRERVRRGLEFDGFRRWNRDAFVRPAWPPTWVIDRAAAHADRTGGLQWYGALVASADLDRLLGLYGLDALHRRARRLAQQVERWTTGIASPSQAWARLIGVGGRVIRTLSRDPLLPPELWGTRTGMRELIDAYREFERAAGPRSETFVRMALRGERTPISIPGRKARRLCMRDVVVPLDFLLGSASPWVRYQTKLALLGEPGTAERREVLAHPVVGRLLKEAQSWPGNSRGDHRAARDLLNKLSLLADFGLRASDPGVRLFVERVLAHADGDGRLLGYVLFPRQAKPAWMFDVDGQDGLLALVALGCGEDRRVRRALAALLALESAGGGWIWPEARSPLPCRQFTGGCPYPTIKILRILAGSGGAVDSMAARRGTELLLSLWDGRDGERRYGFGMGEHFTRLRYPFVWFDVLHVLEALSPYPWAWSDPRFHSLLETVLNKADAAGRFTPESVYLEWKNECFGQKRAPSPWLTLVVHRILSRQERATPRKRVTSRVAAGRITTRSRP